MKVFLNFLIIFLILKLKEIWTKLKESNRYLWFILLKKRRKYEMGRSHVHFSIVHENVGKLSFTFIKAFQGF